LKCILNFINNKIEINILLFILIGIIYSLEEERNIRLADERENFFSNVSCSQCRNFLGFKIIELDVNLIEK